MIRVNPDIARLEATIAMYKRADAERRKPPGDMPVTGCNDYGCIVAPPVGMATNGRCRCDERTLRRALQWERRRVEFMTATIQDMREEATRLEVERMAASIAMANTRDEQR